MGALMAAKPGEGAEEKNSRVLGLGRRRRSCGGIGEWGGGIVWRRIGFPALEDMGFYLLQVSDGLGPMDAHYIGYPSK
jgi:hypothetical protein